MIRCAGTGELLLKKYPESEVALGCNLIIEKIMGDRRKRKK
jgi:hypothetical protein